MLIASVPPALAAGGDQEEEEIIDLVGAEEEDDFMDEFALLQEEDIIYAAAKHEQDIAESPSAITVITREQIENTHCTHIPCLLRQVPEVHVRQLHPMFAAVGARALAGESGDKALVLIDGREVNVEIFGLVYWQALTIHLDDIERIEIIRGPGSALYGANAHSMVVSIVTRGTTEDSAEFFVGSGEHDRSAVHMRLEKALGKWRLQVSGGYETGGHWRMPDQRQQELGRIRLRVDRETDTATSSLQLGLVVPEGQVYISLAPTFSYNAYLGYAIASHRTEFYRAQLSLGLVTSDFHLDMPLYYGEVKLGEFPEVLDFFSTNLDADMQVTWEPFEGNLLIAGGNYRWITLVADNNQPDLVHQHRIGVLLHDEQRLGKSLILTGGVRIDYNNITPFTASPRFACVWRFAQEQFLRLSFGRAFRKPSFMNTSAHFRNVKGEPGFPGLEDFFLRSVGNDGVTQVSVVR
ncbi:TonB-dependent receptor plug domain-containing protein, partial [Myxococcota bacterium]